MAPRTPAGTPQRSLARDVVPSSLVMALAIVVPAVLLLLIWKRPVPYLPILLSVANDEERYHEVLLVIIPLTILGCATGFLFLTQFDLSRTKAPRLFVPCFVIQILVMFPCPLVFFGYALNYKDQALPDFDFYFVSTLVVLSIVALFLSDGYMALCRAEKRQHRPPGRSHHTPPAPPSTPAAPPG
jgi:hypothetical protein